MNTDRLGHRVLLDGGRLALWKVNRFGWLGASCHADWSVRWKSTCQTPWGVGAWSDCSVPSLSDVGLQRMPHPEARH